MHDSRIAWGSALDSNTTGGALPFAARITLLGCLVYDGLRKHWSFLHCNLGWRQLIRRLGYVGIADWKWFNWKGFKSFKYGLWVREPHARKMGQIQRPSVCSSPLPLQSPIPIISIARNILKNGTINQDNSNRVMVSSPLHFFSSRFLNSRSTAFHKQHNYLCF